MKPEKYEDCVVSALNSASLYKEVWWYRRIKPQFVMAVNSL
jgi:hypothetical protein